MAKSTGIIIAVGGVTMFNQVILNSQPIDFRVPVATGFVAVAFSFMERVNAKLTIGVAWIALLTVLLVRLNKNPAPVETLLKQWNKGR